MFPAGLLGNFYRANGQLEMNQYRPAEELLRGITSETSDPAVEANLSVALIGLQRFDQAERVAQKAAETAPQRADVGLILAAALEASGKLGRGNPAPTRGET